MRTVEAQIRIENANFRHFAFAVLILAGLLSGFFWLGYWTAESKTVSLELRNPVTIDETRPAHQGKDNISPTKELKIDPKDLVRL